MDAIRAGWVRLYAIAVARLGAIYQLVVLGLWIVRRPNPYDIVIFFLWLGLVGLLFFRVALRVTGAYLVFAFTVGTFVSLHAQGFLGVTGSLICTLPLCAAVFTARTGATLAGLAILAAYACFGYAHVAGWVNAFVPPLRTYDMSAWVWVATSFIVVTLSTVALLGRVTDDLDAAASRYLLARDDLERMGISRHRAEHARDAVLSARERSRNVEALGLVAGSALHDVNNMATVIGSWAELLETESGVPPEAVEAAEKIRAVCRRLGTLGHEVLGLGRGQSSAPSRIRLSEALPVAALVLRRALPEDIALDVNVAGADSEPEIPLGTADLIHVLLEAVTSLVPRFGDGSVVRLTVAARDSVEPDAVFATISVRHVGASSAAPDSAVEEEETLATDAIIVVHRRTDPDGVELRLRPGARSSP